MESDIYQIEYEKDRFKTEKNNFYDTTISYINQTNDERSNEIKNKINYFNNYMNFYLLKLENKIESYKYSINLGKSYIKKIDNYNERLIETKNRFSNYNYEIKNIKSDIQEFRNNINFLKKINPEDVSNPIYLYNQPVYKPDIINYNKLTEKEINKGINMISLQTIFPNVLILITLFLSILVSTFISLNHINSEAKIMLNLIEDVFIHEIFSIYVSSLIIVITPTFFVLLVGNYLFKINIFFNFNLIILIILFLCSTFIFLGMFISYIIKKESITFLLSSFILVFFVFFSGFILPSERMSTIFSYFSSNSPTKIAVSALIKVSFYNQTNIIKEIFIMLEWLLFPFILCISAKKIKNE
ncbi:MAG: ABC transporter permease [Candidatus Aenigmatarchaeota archaeon]